MHRSTVRRTSALLGTAAILLAACAAPAVTPAGGATPTPDPPETSTPEATDSPTAEPTESPSPEPTEGAAEVTLGMSSFSPTQLTIAVGTEVTFTNDSGLPHTVTHGTGGRAVDDPAFDRAISDGGTVRITFDEPGTYDVTCKIHPTMQMTIVVEG